MTDSSSLIGTDTHRLMKILGRYSSILIVIKGSPDPDAIASSFMVTELCATLGVKTQIAATNKLSLPQNKAFVKRLNIPIHFSDRLPEADKFDAYIVCDHPSAAVESITGTIPCAAHIDHHEPDENEIPADFRIIRRDIGSTCTIMALLLKNSPDIFTQPVLNNIATALLFGIQTDTDKYRHATELDYAAIDYLYPLANQRMLTRISGIPMSEKTVQYLGRAVKNQEVYKNWLITGIGFIDETDRDSIALIADFLLTREKASVVAVFAIIEKKNRRQYSLDVSLRTDSDSTNLNSLIKGITQNGGARNYKGAYQISLDYFRYCPDRDLLWQTVRLATIEQLKKQRDELTLKDIRGYLSGIRSRASSIFKKFSK
jgi:nanoRNase/pAp phosphatase (c-di-AMP/oligoRNAs hydrolase)